MNYVVLAILLLRFTTAEAFSVDSNSMTVTLRKAVVSESKARMDWEIVLSNASPASIRFSQFSLASALRAAKFADDTGHQWKMLRPKLIIDPPSPEVDFRLRVAPKASTVIRLNTDGLERVLDVKERTRAKDRPERLHYSLDRDVDIIVDTSQRWSSSRCVGKGVVEINWSLQ